MTDDQVRGAVGTSIGSLVNERPELDLDAVHERSIAHRLAVHFDLVFIGWNVDCEYDRDGQLKKTLLGTAGCRGKATNEILPDIIVHHHLGRGRDNNLLVVEMKKHVDEDRCDKRKLELLTAQDGRFQYRFGLYVNINKGQFNCSWYKDGKRSV